MREVSGATVTFDDPTKSVQLNATLLGAACNKKNRWQLQLVKNADMLFNDDHKCILSFIEQIPGGNMLLTDNLTVNLPNGAGNVKNDPRSGLLSFSLNRPVKTGECSLDAACGPSRV